MMYRLNLKITQSRPPELLMREWNSLVREALEQDVAKFWIANYLPLHFQPSAVQRYSYAARTDKYLRRKRTKDKVKIKTKVVPIWKPTGPLILTGELMNSLLGKSPEAFNSKATVTSKKWQLRVPLRIPHPINPRNSGELSRLVKEETSKLQSLAIKSISNRMIFLKRVKTIKIAA